MEQGRLFSTNMTFNFILIWQEIYRLMSLLTQETLSTSTLYPWHCINPSIQLGHLISHSILSQQAKWQSPFNTYLNITFTLSTWANNGNGSSGLLCSRTDVTVSLSSTPTTRKHPPTHNCIINTVTTTIIMCRNNAYIISFTLIWPYLSCLYNPWRLSNFPRVITQKLAKPTFLISGECHL